MRFGTRGQVAGRDYEGIVQWRQAATSPHQPFSFEMTHWEMATYLLRRRLGIGSHPRRVSSEAPELPIPLRFYEKSGLGAALLQDALMCSSSSIILNDSISIGPCGVFLGPIGPPDQGSMTE